MPSTYQRVTEWKVTTNGRGLNVLMFDNEMAYGNKVGKKRREHAVSIGAQERHGHSGDEERAIKEHQFSACAELAVLKSLKLDGFFPEWHSIPKTWGEPDLVFERIDTVIDVKARRFDRYDLLLPEYKDDWIYFYVSVEHSPVFWLAGWCFGWEIHDLGARWWNNPDPRRPDGGGWLIETGRLHKWWELLRMLRARNS